MIPLRIPILCAIAIPCFSACYSSPYGCDPSRADFFNNTACLAGGAYDTRQARLRSDLARERHLNREFHAVYAALQEEPAGLGSPRTAPGYDKLDRAWRDLQNELERGRGENRELAQRIDEIERDLAARKQPTGNTNLRTKQQRRADLQRKLGLLQRELETGIYD